MDNGGVSKLYQPWPAPVRAACFVDTTVLPEIEAWVGELRDRGLVGAGTYFTIERRGNALIGVLHDLVGDHELLPRSFLVFGHGGLEILDESAFLRHYRVG